MIVSEMTCVSMSRWGVYKKVARAFLNQPGSDSKNSL